MRRFSGVICQAVLVPLGEILVRQAGGVGNTRQKRIERSVTMRFEGDELIEILTHQTESVRILDEYGRLEIEYRCASAACGLVRRGNYHGFGHRKRIRVIRPA